ncbi:MAG: transcription initiation factor IIB [Candidatus Helarchaeota archaeon]
MSKTLWNPHEKTAINQQPDLDECPECGSKNIIRDYVRGELICSNCGIVLEDHIIDNSRGVRSFSPEERNARDQHGSPSTLMLPDKGLSTQIDKKTPNNMKARERQKFERIRKWQNRMTWQQRNLSIATNEIRRLASQLDLPDNVSESAAKLYRKVYKKDLLKGRSIKCMVAAAVYVACRQQQLPIPLSKIARFTLDKEKSIRHCLRIIQRELNIKVNTIHPKSLIAQMASQLKLSNDIQKDATEIITKAEKKGMLSGKDPKGIAAAALYLASLKNEDRRSQNQVARVAGITEVTLRNRFKDLNKVATI